MRYILVLTSTLFSVSCLAEESLDTVTVLASDYADEQNTVDGRHFSRDQLSQGHTTLADFLQQQSGVQVQSTAALGDPVMVSLQGADPRQTAILIDGLEAPSNQYGGYDLGLLPLSQIDSVEVSSMHSDASAIGGTVNITTRPPDSAQLDTQLGAFGLRQLSWQQPLNRRTHVRLHHLASANDFDYPVPSPLNAPNNRGQQQALNNANYQRYDLGLEQRWPSLRWQLDYQNSRKQYPDYFTNQAQDAHYQQQALSARISGDWHQGDGHQWQLAWRGHDDHYRDRDGNIGLGQQDNRYFGHHINALWRSHFNSGQQRTQFTTRLQQQRYVSRHQLDEASKDCQQVRAACDLLSLRRQLKLQLMQQWQWSPYRLQWSLGQRFIRDNSRTRNGQSEQQNQQWQNGHISLSRQWQGWQGQLSAKRAVRTASLFERFGDRGLLRPSPDLNAERANSLHLDMVVTQPWQSRISLFSRWLNDAIVPVYDSRGIGRYENTDAAQVRGLEWQTRSPSFTIGPWQLEASAAGSHYQSHTDSDLKAFAGQQLAGIYHQRWHFTLALQHGPQRLQLSHEWADDLYIDRANLIAGDGRRLWQLHYRWQRARWHSGLRINNLTDQRYRDFSNRPARPRDWQIYFSMQF